MWRVVVKSRAHGSCEGIREKDEPFARPLNTHTGSPWLLVLAVRNCFEAAD